VPHMRGHCDQREDDASCGFEVLFQVKGIEGLPKAGETLFCGFGNVWALHDPLIGSLRGMVCLAGAYAGGGFLLEFQRGTEVIVERAPRVGVQIVHQVDQLGILKRA